MKTTIFFVAVFAINAGIGFADEKAQSQPPPPYPALEKVTGWLKQYEHREKGTLPDSFRVRIEIDGYLTRERKDGSVHHRPREVYEFTPTEVRRFCLRVVGQKDDGRDAFKKDADGYHAFEVVSKKPFTEIDQICRILLALDYPDLVDPKDEAYRKNHHYLQVFTDTGLRPLGAANITVGTDALKVDTHESCLGAFSPDSAHSIRFAALYHTLRRLARSKLGLSGDDWRDALDVIDADGSIRPAKGYFRAHE